MNLDAATRITVGKSYPSVDGKRITVYRKKGGMVLSRENLRLETDPDNLKIELVITSKDFKARIEDAERKVSMEQNFRSKEDLFDFFRDVFEDFQNEEVK